MTEGYLCIALWKTAVSAAADRHTKKRLGINNRTRPICGPNFSSEN